MFLFLRSCAQTSFGYQKKVHIFIFFRVVHRQVANATHLERPKWHQIKVQKIQNRSFVPVLKVFCIDSILFINCFSIYIYIDYIDYIEIYVHIYIHLYSQLPGGSQIGRKLYTENIQIKPSYVSKDLLALHGPVAFLQVLYIDSICLKQKRWCSQ